MKLYATFLTVLFLTGCAHFELQAMSRTDGKVYQGTAEQTGRGHGTISLVLKDVVYNGTFALTGSDMYTSFVNAYASNSTGQSANAFGYAAGGGHNATFSAILSSSSGDGLRCMFNGDGKLGTGGGICVDAQKNVYDMVYNMK